MKMWTAEALRVDQQVQTLYKHYRNTPGILWEVKGRSRLFHLWVSTPEEMKTHSMPMDFHLSFNVSNQMLGIAQISIKR